VIDGGTVQTERGAHFMLICSSLTCLPRGSTQVSLSISDASKVEIFLVLRESEVHIGEFIYGILC
jgi:hypothetical protein